MQKPAESCLLFLRHAGGPPLGSCLSNRSRCGTVRILLLLLLASWSVCAAALAIAQLRVESHSFCFQETFGRFGPSNKPTRRPKHTAIAYHFLWRSSSKQVSTPILRRCICESESPATILTRSNTATRSKRSHLRTPSACSQQTAQRHPGYETKH